MIQVIETTHQEKVEMYQRIEKDKLIEMLIEANRIISLVCNKYNIGNIIMNTED